MPDDCPRCAVIPDQVRRRSAAGCDHIAVNMTRRAVCDVNLLAGRGRYIRLGERLPRCGHAEVLLRLCQILVRHSAPAVELRECSVALELDSSSVCCVCHFNSPSCAGWGGFYPPQFQLYGLAICCLC